MREERIGTCCEICGKTEGPLVLQHMWHPPSYSQVLYEISQELQLPQEHALVKSKTYELYQANHQRYISGEDAQTFCEKCAYMWDVHNMRLCDKCRERYHSLQDRMCKRCARQERDKKIYGKDLFENLI